MSFADVMREVVAKEERTKVANEASRALRNLKRQRKELAEKQQKLMQNIATGEVGDENCPPVQHEQEQEMIQRRAKLYYDVTKSKQKLEGLAFLTGVTAMQQDNGDINFILDPYIQGENMGMYSIYTDSRYTLLEHSLPKSVPVRDIYKEHVDPRKQISKKDFKLFLRSVFRHLRAYLSRKSQVTQLKEDKVLSEFIREVQHSSNFTYVKVQILIFETDNNQNVLLDIRLRYADDGERPLPDSLQVDSTDKENIGILTEQCQVLYTTRLRDGLLSAFANE